MVKLSELKDDQKLIVKKEYDCIGEVIGISDYKANKGKYRGWKVYSAKPIYAEFSWRQLIDIWEDDLDAYDDWELEVKEALYNDSRFKEIENIVEDIFDDILSHFPVYVEVEGVNTDE